MTSTTVTSDDVDRGARAATVHSLDQYRRRKLAQLHEECSQPPVLDVDPNAEYRCDSCHATFDNLAELVDHLS